MKIGEWWGEVGVWGNWVGSLSGLSATPSLDPERERSDGNIFMVCEKKGGIMGQRTHVSTTSRSAYPLSGAAVTPVRPHAERSQLVNNAKQMPEDPLSIYIPSKGKASVVHYPSLQPFGGGRQRRDCLCQLPLHSDGPPVSVCSQNTRRMADSTIPIYSGTREILRKKCKNAKVE